MRKHQQKPKQASRWMETDIPARLDRLPWAGWHLLVVTALGVTWILDGLEVTLAGAVGGMLTRPEALGMTDAQVGASAACYLAGAVAGALGFGYGTDRLGRKRLFYATVIVYLLGTAATACAWNFASYAIFRAITGAGIGGEYAAINSAIDELIPARFRGRVALGVNATYWIGAALGSGASVILLGWLPPGLGWRVAYGLGAVIGVGVLIFRHWVPESPRWLMIHGRLDEANEVVRGVEKKIEASSGKLTPPEGPKIRFHPRQSTPWREIWNAVARRHRSRSLLAMTLMVAQAFFYNAIFFTYGLVLVRFYHVPASMSGAYLLPFALGNALGPICLGHLFDSIGRRVMITLTYGVSGLLLAVAGFLFQIGVLDAKTQTIAWMVIFFVASAAASSAYLTASEVFPLEIRALAIALFYAGGTLVGGVGAPLLFGWLIECSSTSGERWPLFLGYLLAAVLMIAAAATEAVAGVNSERRSLEDIAPPLSSS